MKPKQTAPLIEPMDIARALDFDGLLFMTLGEVLDALRKAPLTEILGVETDTPPVKVASAFRTRVAALAGAFGVPIDPNDLYALECIFEVLERSKDVLMDKDERASYLSSSAAMGRGPLSYQSHILDHSKPRKIRRKRRSRPRKRAESRAKRRVVMAMAGLALLNVGLVAIVLVILALRGQF